MVLFLRNYAKHIGAQFSAGAWGTAEKRLGKSDVKKTEQTIYTAGELFSDGTAIDMLGDGKLALWEEGHKSAKIAREVQLRGVTYRPVMLVDSLRKLLRLPSRVSQTHSLEELGLDLTKFIKKYSSLDPNEALLVAAFVLATWVTESLPSAPCLNLWGPLGSGASLVALLECLCRRALRVVDPSVRQLSKFPSGVLSTLVLNHPTGTSLKQLLATLENPDAVVLQNGEVLNLRYATIVCTQEPVSPLAIRIRVLPAGKREEHLTCAEADALADYFQPRLQAYRFRQHVTVSRSEFDVSEFEPEVRLMAQTLGAALDGVWPSRADVPLALLELDEQAKFDRSHSLAAFVLEVLLALCHGNKQTAYVGEVAELVNAIAIGRHDEREVTPKKVGRILRKKLGLTPGKNTGRGYSLSLDRETASRVHRLAASYKVASLVYPDKPCQLCRQLWPPSDPDASDFFETLAYARRDQVDTGEFDDDFDLENEEHVHHVQKVHNVHATNGPVEEEAGQKEGRSTIL